MRDFTLRRYEALLGCLQKAGYGFLTMEQYFRKTGAGEALPEKFVILRHDVDKLANNSDKVSKIESSHDVRATYYFRLTESSNDPQVIRNIASRGHEIGYHYEDLVQTDGDLARAGAHFAEAIEYFRHFYPVTTICMHGSPRSPYDPKELWKHMSYRAYGIIGEPYLDADFNDLFYLTDTGRCWDGWRFSRRDKVSDELQRRWIAAGWVYHSTSDIVQAIGQGTFPPHVMMTSHPQRWTDARLAWCRELLLQKAKNLVKRYLIAKRGGIAAEAKTA